MQRSRRRDAARGTDRVSVRFSSDDLLNRAGIVHAAIMRGEVIAYPTETFYGLGADPRNPEAIERIYAIKGRRAGEALPLIAQEFDVLVELGVPIPHIARKLAEAFWPGSLTLVLPIASGRFPDVLTAGGSTVAVRVPDHPVARALAAIAGGLITSTSANRSGHPPASTADDVHAALGDDIAVLVDGGTTPGGGPGGAPSTIVDVTSETPRLIRAGVVAWERVLESLKR
jgi:L-threonylcarbamoyladenylate synthase